MHHRKSIRYHKSLWFLACKNDAQILIHTFSLITSYSIFSDCKYQFTCFSLEFLLGVWLEFLGFRQNTVFIFNCRVEYSVNTCTWSRCSRAGFFNQPTPSSTGTFAHRTIKNRRLSYLLIIHGHGLDVTMKLTSNTLEIDR